MKSNLNHLKNLTLVFAILGSLGLISGCSGKNSGEEGLTADQDGDLVQVDNPAPTVGNCLPTTCESQGKNCGEIADGCGGTLSCGDCSGNESCGGGGTENVCGVAGALPTGPNTPTPSPEPPPANTPPVTCYRYGFISNRDNGAENVFFSDTCKNLEDPSLVSFGFNLIDHSVIDRPRVGFPGNSTPSNGPRRLTNNSNTDRYFGSIAFKPDGTQMAYGQARFSDPVFNPKAFLGDPNGASPFSALDEALGFNTDPDPRAVDFRHDGNAIAYILPQDQQFCDVDLDTGGCNNITLRLQHVMVNDPIDGNHKVVNATSEDQIFEKVLFHPTENKLIYSEKKGSDPFFLKLFFFGGGSSDLIERFQSGFPIPLQGFQPAIKPNGSQLAFVRDINGRNQVFRCTFRSRLNANNQPVETCEDVEQLTHIGTNTEPSFTPDGQFIFFTSNRDGYSAIYKMNADGSEEERLTPENVQYHSAVVHPVSFTQ